LRQHPACHRGREQDRDQDCLAYVHRPAVAASTSSQTSRTAPWPPAARVV
jgi:hypothetical protein